MLGAEDNGEAYPAAGVGAEPRSGVMSALSAVVVSGAEGGEENLWGAAEGDVISRDRNGPLQGGACNNLLRGSSGSKEDCGDPPEGHEDQMKHIAHYNIGLKIGLHPGLGVGGEDRAAQVTERRSEGD
ncbi:hypothetical protein NDU88_005979 [Pleurodeles waltl]|uniref:Uncharacterized protein n=1 Tax=Pleurodeles waltl TaxID=8319 RepID=A0AAV7N2R1_PLEWA|nr:hypothetical protein NDU88_005979 [Pleurodeles waltl]